MRSRPTHAGTMRPTQRHVQAAGLTSTAPIAAPEPAATTTATPKATASPAATTKAAPASTPATTATSAAAARVHVDFQVPASSLCAVILAGSILQDTIGPTVKKEAETCTQHSQVTTGSWGALCACQQGLQGNGGRSWLQAL